MDQNTLRAAYPQLSEDELREAAVNLDRYLELALEVCDDVRRDPERYGELRRRLTEERDRKRIEELRAIAATRPCSIVRRDRMR